MKLAWRTWLRDPLLHFAVAGLALYVVIPREVDVSSDRIEVSREQLLEFMQGRARLYDASSFAQAYEALAPAERALLLQDYVRQEALYREALNNRLDQADPLVRSRMVQQMELLLRDEAMATSDISAEEVEAYFAAHSDDYALPSTVSFAHVFLDQQKHGARAEATARSLLEQLRRQQVTAEDAISFGDRFPYQRNYSGMTARALAPEVGEAVARAVFTAPQGEWQGPFTSPLGQHLVLVSRRSAAQAPDLAAIRDQVSQDALQDKRAALGEQAVQRVIASYRILPAGDLGELADPDETDNVVQ